MIIEQTIEAERTGILPEGWIWCEECKCNYTLGVCPTHGG